MRKRFFCPRIKGLILIAGILLILTLTILPIQAADHSTTTTILPSSSIVTPDDEIQFSIFVYSGFDPVPFGQLRLLDTETGETLDTTIINGTAVVSWIITGSLGLHTFRASYLGHLNYKPSLGECGVISEDINPGGRETSLILTVNTTNVYKNASLHFNIALYIHYRYWFQGGYVTVKNKNLTGSSTIFTYGPIENYYPGTDPALLNLEFDYQIPTFSSLGKNQFISDYTGSSESATAPCTSNVVEVDVLSTGYFLAQSINATTVLRAEESIEINTTIIGDNPTELMMRVYYFRDSELIILSDVTLQGRNHEIIFLPNSSTPLGELNLLSELYNEQGIVYANNSETIIIQDRAQIHYSLNASEYNQNDTVRFEVYVTEEDILTTPVDCQVELVDIDEGNVSISNSSTNLDGFVVFSFVIPENAKVGGHKFGLRVFNISNPYILGVMSEVIVSIKGLIDIDLTYESGVVIRNTFTDIQVTVLSGGITLNEGIVALLYHNGTIIETQNCVAGLIFNHFISNNYPLGTINYLVHYYGSSIYDESYKNFNLTIFSTPNIDSLGQNSSEVIKGQAVRFWGYLLDEVGTPLYYQYVSILDLTTGEEKGSALTNDQGMFFYDFYVSQITQIGVHLIEFTFSGDPSNYFLSSINEPIVSITVRPPLSVMVDESILADSWTEIRLEGGLMEIISLSWLKDNESSWEYIADIQLNSSGLAIYNWSTPYHKGGISLRASSSNSTKYDHTFMYVIPDITAIASEVGYVNEIFGFTLNCSERYQVWIEEQLWMDWNDAGVHFYEYNFETRGLKTITVISNDTYVYYNEFRLEIPIFEDVIISISVPSEALPNITVNIDGNVMGEVSGPISGLDTFLLINGTEFEVDSSNFAGEFHFSLPFTQVGVYSIEVKTHIVVENFFSSSFSNIVIIKIVSLPATLEILSPENNSVYGSIVEISFSGNAIGYWYYIESIDQVNYSWTETIYRTMSEGSFKCHVFAENQYGIVTYAFTYFEVDLTKPSLVVLSPMNTSYITNNVELSYLTDEEQVIVILDNNIIGYKESGTDFEGLSEGTHNLTIQVEDSARNRIEKTVLFSIDTILPSLVIHSPYNRSYNRNVTLSFSSNGSKILYYLSGISETNLTYTTPISLNLPINQYHLFVYAFDNAGNTICMSVEFSIVEGVDLLLNSQLEIIDGGGNYLISTSLQSNPNFEKVGIYLNGSYFGELLWNSISQVYRLNVQLPSPGTWAILLFAKTSDNKFDFDTFLVNWLPTKPEISYFSAYWESSHYELCVKIDTESLPLELVQVRVQNVNYDCYFYTFTSEWRVQLNILPENYSIELGIWYPWDINPIVQREYNLYWYAPIIIVENFESSRDGFSMNIRVEKGNSSLSSELLKLKIENHKDNYEVTGTMIYRAVTGNYEIWSFSSPILPPGLWNLSMNVSDVYGLTNNYNKIFNITDIPPHIGEVSVNLISNTSTGSLYRIIAEIFDDYTLIETCLLINGEKYYVYQINETHVGVEFFLAEGAYAVQLSVTDDLNQQTIQFITNIHVVNGIVSTTSPNTTRINTTSKNNSPFTSENLNLATNDFFDLSFASGITASLIAVGSAITRRKRVLK